MFLYVFCLSYACAMYVWHVHFKECDVIIHVHFKGCDVIITYLNYPVDARCFACAAIRARFLI